MHNPSVQRVKSKDTDFEYRLLWVSSFILVLPTLIIKRLLPTHWSGWRQGKSVFTVVCDAKRTANMLAGMAYKAF